MRILAAAITTLFCSAVVFAVQPVETYFVYVASFSGNFSNILSAGYKSTETVHSFERPFLSKWSGCADPNIRIMQIAFKSPSEKSYFDGLESNGSIRKYMEVVWENVDKVPVVKFFMVKPKSCDSFLVKGST